MEDALKAVLAQMIGDRSVLEIARRSGVNHPGIYAILDGRSKRPSPSMLEKLSRELHPSDEDWADTYKRLALAAYGVVIPLRGENPQEWDDTAPLEEAPPADSNNGHEWKRAGPRPKAVSAAT